MNKISLYKKWNIGILISIVILIVINFIFSDNMENLNIILFIMIANAFTYTAMVYNNLNYACAVGGGTGRNLLAIVFAPIYSVAMLFM